MDRSAEGRAGTPFTLDVERGKVREFARAVRAEHPAYAEGEELVTPPTFLTTMFHCESEVPGANPWSLLNVDQKRGLHAEQEYVFHGPPPRVGVRLTCQSRIERVYEKAGRRGGTLTFAVLVTEFRDSSGKLVAEARMTGVETAENPEQR
jgi:MaoC dehydratase-like protein